jgi:hypothetical protein
MIFRSVSITVFWDVTPCSPIDWDITKYNYIDFLNSFSSLFTLDISLVFYKHHLESV